MFGLDKRLVSFIFILYSRRLFPPSLSMDVLFHLQTLFEIDYFVFNVDRYLISLPKSKGEIRLVVPTK